MNELKITGYVLYGISSIYGAIFRRFHRKWITHFPGVSTVIRLAFILLPIGVLWPGLLDYPVVLIGVWFGLSIADALHYLIDKFGGKIKYNFTKLIKNMGRNKKNPARKRKPFR